MIQLCSKHKLTLTGVTIAIFFSYKGGEEQIRQMNATITKDII